MRFALWIFIFALFFLNGQLASGAENEYGIVRAWFNDENATVEGVQLKIGEPVEVKVEILSKINGHITIILQEPGITKAFEVLSGPSKVDEKISNLNVESGWSKIYEWKISPNADWKNGNAPINLLVKFYNIKSKTDKIIQFTIANPYILDEQYTGAAPPTTQAPEITDTGAASKQAPFLSALSSLILILACYLIRRS